MTTSTAYEIVGVGAEFWARDTKSERTSVVIPDHRMNGYNIRSARDLARFLSVSHNDDGMVDFWPEVGGGVMLREVATGKVIARYVNGVPANEDWPPFDDLPADNDEKTVQS